MPLYTDQMQRLLEIPAHPQRIISLVPSQTELLYDLGLGEKVVGITKFCVHPQRWRKEKTIVGGTKNFHPDRIKELKPDLIIGNKEENSREEIEILEKEFPVWMSDIYNLEDALQMIAQIGIITGSEEKGKNITAEIEIKLSHLKPLPAPISCLYFIWRNPFMAVGGNTFVDDIIERCGFRNLLSPQTRYPELSAEEIKEMSPRLILLSSEPYPFKEKDVLEMKNLCPEAEVLLVDGEMFSWYGSRLRSTFPYLQGLMEDLRLRLKI